MTVLGRFRKQPRERLRYRVDYGLWLGDDEEVEGVAVAVGNADDDAAPLVVEAAWIEPVKRVVVLLVKGGSHGVTYPLTLTVTTDGLQTKEVELLIKVAET
jgi:hypothetical protein